MTTTAGREPEHRPAVVVSSSRDAVNVDPVAGLLRRRGVDPIVVCADRVLAGEQDLTLRVAGTAVTLVVDGREVDPREVGCAWWRKPHWARVQRPDRLTAASVEREALAAIDGMCALIPPRAWLNAPSAIRAAEHKPAQLPVAAEIGFDVPDTVMTSSWGAVRELAAREPIVFKALRGSVHSETGNLIAFTRPLDAGGLEELAADTSPWPGIFQRLLQGRCEWRVTVVGDDVLAARITLADGLVDWRRHQLDGGARFERADLPVRWSDACRELARRLSLGFAAIDLIEGRDGVMSFLECNPNGQYGWLEAQLGLPFSEAIAAELARLSDTNTHTARSHA